MDIDFIKWMVGYAEGFEIIINRNGKPRLVYKDYSIFTDQQLFTHIWYPLLRQKTIEGINRKDDPKKYCSPRIYQDPDFIKVYLVPHKTEIEKTKYIPITKDGDQAKEEALKYIYEQEKKNGD